MINLEEWRTVGDGEDEKGVQDHSDCEFFGPFLGRGLVFGPVCFVDVCYFRNQRIVGIGVGQKRADRQQHLGDGEGWGPLFLQDVQADVTIGVDVWMVDFGFELDLRRLERVVGWEMDGKEEDTSCVWGIWRTDDRCLPVEEIVSYWAC